MRVQPLAAPPRRRTVESQADDHGVPTRSNVRRFCSMVDAASRMLKQGLVLTFAPGAGLPVLIGAGVGYRLGAPLAGALLGLLALPLLGLLAGAVWGWLRFNADDGRVTRMQLQHGLRMLGVTSLPAYERLQLACDLVAMAERVYEPVRPILHALMQQPEGLEAAAEGLMAGLPQELTLKAVATLTVLARVGQRYHAVGRRVRPMAMALASGQPDPFCFSRCLQEIRRVCTDHIGQPMPLAVAALR